VRQAWRRDGTAVLLATPAPTGVGVLETAMRALVAAWPAGDAAYAVTTVREAVLRDAPAGDLWSIAWFSPGGAVRPAQADLLVLSQSGELVAALQGIGLSRFQQPAEAPVIPAPRPAPEPQAGPREAFVRRLAEVLGTDVSRVDLRLSLRDMGVDSLTAGQLRRLIGEFTGESVSTSALLEPSSAERLLDRLFTT
jgi:hypothetical protein